MRAHRPSEQGASIVELAILLPFLLLLVFGIIDFGRLLFININLHEAAQEGSIYASTHPDDPLGARQRAIESVDSPVIPIADVVVDCPGSTVRVRITHEVDLLTPWFGGGTFTLGAEVYGDKFSSQPCVASP
jgi:hypothetical protein